MENIYTVVRVLSVKDEPTDCRTLHFYKNLKVESWASIATEIGPTVAEADLQACPLPRGILVYPAKDDSNSDFVLDEGGIDRVY